jgi:hypothetical protein
MKKSLLLVAMTLCLGATTQAKAETYKYTCTLVNDFDDWSVRVGDHQADFFDNDGNCILKRTGAAGKPTYDRTEDCNSDQKVSFVFNQEKMTAQLKFPDGLETDGGTKSFLKMTCSEGAYQDQ